jgi:hypothetical protein
LQRLAIEQRSLTFDTVGDPEQLRLADLPVYGFTRPLFMLITGELRLRTLTRRRRIGRLGPSIYVQQITEPRIGNPRFVQ